MLCGRFVVNIPAGKYKNSRVALQCPGKYLGSLNAKANTIILDGREGGLGNTGQIGKFVLTQLLQLSQYPN